VTALPLILTVFVACAVEAIEALTIVLAAGLTREWRSTFQGMAVALVVLAAIVAALGPTITLLPLTALRLVVGALLAIFGLQWLRKAILRATGYKSLHDEASAYLREVAAAKAAATSSRGRVRDWYAFTLSFKGVLLEGLEVIFIVITFGANQRNVGAAVIGAAAAVVVVAVTGVLVRAPLAKVPENALKFAVGIMLTSFGIFWGAEGAGVAWPGNDAALLVLVPVVALVALGYTVLLRRPQGVRAHVRAHVRVRVRVGGGDQLMRRLKSIGAFWYDFVVGDDWRVAVVVVAALALTALLVHAAGVDVWWLLPVCVFAALGWSLRRATRS
jgi:uncharacterized membrane protein